jgi:cell division topological specificity factor
MGVFEFMIGRKKPSPGELAKERLKFVLVHDRMKVNPELLDLIKDELLADAARFCHARLCDTRLYIEIRG